MLGENDGCFVGLSFYSTDILDVSVFHCSIMSVFSGLDDGSALTACNDSFQDDE
jgi:hypothetical protein